MNRDFMNWVRIATAFACFSQIPSGIALAQEQRVPGDSASKLEAGEQSVTVDQTIETRDFSEAFENLCNRKFAIRRAAKRELAKAGVNVLAEIETRALSSDPDFQYQCIDLISMIGRDHDGLEESAEALQRLSEDRNFASAGKAYLEMLALRQICINRAVKSLTESGARITRLGANGPVYSVRDITTDEQCAKLKYLPRLSSIALSGSKITDTCFEHLSKVKPLQSLYVQGVSVSGKGISRLEKLADLRRLTITGNFPADSFDALADLKQVTSLNLSVPLGKEELETVAALPLSSLSLMQLNNDPKTFSVLGKIKAQSLRVNLQSIKNEDLKWVRDCESSKLALSIYNSKDLTDEGIEVLANNTTLNQLTLSQTGITADSMKPLGTLTELTSLSITNSPIDNASLLHLSKLVKLRMLTMNGTKVTGEGMAALKKKLPQSIQMRPSPPTKKTSKARVPNIKPPAVKPPAVKPPAAKQPAVKPPAAKQQPPA